MARMGHLWREIGHCCLVLFSYFCPGFNKRPKEKYDYSKQKMDTADRDCRLYSVDGILQAGIGCGSEIFFLCSNADRSGG